ncbi:retrovirus-related pol polyprotein from transposon TNT 1-94 [Tanacetum coccineum]
MAYASPICLMDCATSTKSWLWHQRLSHLNFNTINDLAKNDIVTGLPKFKYHKEHLCPSCEQGKSKKASHPPKPVPNSKQSGDYSRYTGTLSRSKMKHPSLPFNSSKKWSRGTLKLNASGGARTNVDCLSCTIILIGLKQIVIIDMRYGRSLVQKVILASSLVILLFPVLIEFTTEGKEDYGDNECDI